MGRIVGIDLGTTNSLVAYADAQDGQPKCIPGPYGSTLCPSVVSIDAFADAARAQHLFREAADGARACGRSG